MKVVKVYRLINYISFAFPLKVNGEKRFISFKHGVSNPRLNGKYVSSDPDEQKALEESPAFNVQYKIEAVRGGEAEATSKTEDNAPEEVLPTEPESSEADTPEAEVPVAEEPKAEDEAEPEAENTLEVIPADEVAGVQDAKEYLVNHHDCNIEDLPNKQAVMAKAKELGIRFAKVR